MAQALYYDRLVLSYSTYGPAKLVVTYMWVLSKEFGSAND